MKRNLSVLPMLTVALGVLPATLWAEAVADSWTEKKCALYTSAWTQLVGEDRPESVSEEFMTDHADFLASGCLDRGNVCPRSPRERELSDLLSLMAVSEGMAGSFLPFNCVDGADMGAQQ